MRIGAAGMVDQCRSRSEAASKARLHGRVYTVLVDLDLLNAHQGFAG